MKGSRQCMRAKRLIVNAERNPFSLISRYHRVDADARCNTVRSSMADSKCCEKQAIVNVDRIMITITKNPIYLSIYLSYNSPPSALPIPTQHPTTTTTFTTLIRTNPPNPPQNQTPPPHYPPHSPPNSLPPNIQII